MGKKERNNSNWLLKKKRRDEKRSKFYVITRTVNTAVFIRKKGVNFYLRPKLKDNNGHFC